MSYTFKNSLINNNEKVSLEKALDFVRKGNSLLPESVIEHQKEEYKKGNLGIPSQAILLTTMSKRKTVVSTLNTENIRAIKMKKRLQAKLKKKN